MRSNITETDSDLARLTSSRQAVGSMGALDANLPDSSVTAPSMHSALYSPLKLWIELGEFGCICVTPGRAVTDNNFKLFREWKLSY